MSNTITSAKYEKSCQNLMDRYAEAGMSPARLMTDVNRYAFPYHEYNGYCDGLIAGGVVLLISGVISKFLCKKALKRDQRVFQSNLDYHMRLYQQSIAYSKDREENS